LGGGGHKVTQGNRTPETQQYLIANPCCQTRTAHSTQHKHREVVTVVIPAAIYTHFLTYTHKHAHKMMVKARERTGWEVTNEGRRKEGCQIIWHFSAATPHFCVTGAKWAASVTVQKIFFAKTKQSRLLLQGFFTCNSALNLKNWPFKNQPLLHIQIHKITHCFQKH